MDSNSESTLVIGVVSVNKHVMYGVMSQSSFSQPQTGLELNTNLIVMTVDLIHFV